MAENLLTREPLDERIVKSLDGTDVDTPMSNSEHERAFPTLTPAEIDMLRPFGTMQDFADGEQVFGVEDTSVDLFIVESGHMDVWDPACGGSKVVTHHAGGFSGDIDMLTRRPPLVNIIAKGPTRTLRIPAEKIREVLNHVPRFGEKLMNAITLRRKLLVEKGVVGIKVVGGGRCKDTAVIREFLYKNFVPFTWFDPATPKGAMVFAKLGSPKKTPAIQLNNDEVMLNPSVRELAQRAGIWQHCPNRNVDFAIIGAGPAGISAAVYAASEGLVTAVFDRLGPGGQASGSSRIENFIGFPAGLSGMELATRGVLQMLKFGAHMIAPVAVEKFEPAASHDAPHKLHLDCGAVITAATVLVCTGVRWRKLDAENADRFDGAGIYYVCTSVEAMLYDKSDVAIVGAGNSAGQAAMFMAECCPQRTVHVLIRHALGPGMSDYLVNRIRNTKNIKVHEGVQIKSCHGDRRLESVKLYDKNADKESTLPVSAVFVFIGADPSAPWLPESLAKDQLGYLLTGTDVVRSGQWPLADRDPCPLETSIPGLLAAGDIRSGSTKRVGFAVGDGSLAVTCCHRLRAFVKA